jgi:hypothetical protein
MPQCDVSFMAISVALLIAQCVPRSILARSRKPQRQDADRIVVPTTESPSVLAWWIVERHLRSGSPIPGACILAANLLRAANQPHAAGQPARRRGRG